MEFVSDVVDGERLKANIINFTSPDVEMGIDRQTNLSAEKHPSAALMDRGFHESHGSQRTKRPIRSRYVTTVLRAVAHGS